jgi:hypothetical protein
MGNLADYFEKNRYKSVYSIGDRVQGKWNGIPFRGTVGNDTVINLTEGPRISVHSDLPIQYQGRIHTVIFVTHKDVKEFK